MRTTVAHCPSRTPSGARVLALLVLPSAVLLSSCIGRSAEQRGPVPGEARRSMPAETKPMYQTGYSVAAPAQAGAVSGMAEVRDEHPGLRVQKQEGNTEEYDRIHENPFLAVLKNPLSTFSIDVDTASYANVRRYLKQGSRPPADAVRIEELVNYFTYSYPQPEAGQPFSLTTELSACPWNPEHHLLLVGLQGKELPVASLPPMNLVFLIDSSGSMQSPDKLPLLKEAFKLLVRQMRREDSIAIVAYAGSAGLILPPTSGIEKETITEAIESLSAGGSTAGGEGIRLAYKVAREAFRSGGNNRVILATDGDFNVGVSSTAELERLIEEKREERIFLSVLGFGTGNYKDSKMEKLADKGNGNYAYVDSIKEAEKVLVTQMGGTLLTIAKDVKIQIEFNPARVAEYRLIGYENRALRAEDFENDKKDAGELGAGHSVTALYELVPAREGSSTESSTRYQTTKVDPAAARSSEIAVIKLRYKDPEGETSRLLEETVGSTVTPPEATSDNFRFASAVVEWGLFLRKSEFKGRASLENVEARARGAAGKDSEGYRGEFLELVGTTRKLERRLKETT
ncbi:MAG: VWA domain-containing protein [Thermoanaerobaculia bacterium]|nr:VWA domain-containing protein [Thermoanaerobaculia bacterium]